ncbi:MAG TPA: alanine racemase [Burkholderiales bacterium]|nr:alanine racemase [Burkholderiales bacterium]
MSRPLQARINLSALQNNLAVARQHAPNSRIMAVIKANGYGHGLLRVARAVADADGFAVIELNDAVALREAGLRQTILLLNGYYDVEELPVIAAHGLAVVIHNQEQLKMLAALSLPSKLEVFLKLNTGMNRLGFRPEAAKTVLGQLRENKKVGGITLMTHFAFADVKEGIAGQMERFNKFAAGMNLPKSLANSAALLRYPESHAEWVRPGIMLYGSSPYGDVGAGELGLQPVMTLASRLIAMHELQAGERVGYTGVFTAEKRMKIGIVACGYADGYPRHARTGTPVNVNGKITRTLGRISMDTLCVDLSEIPDAAVGTPVILWGEGNPVEEVARAAGTVGYELLTKLNSRVPVIETNG